MKLEGEMAEEFLFLQEMEEKEFLELMLGK